MKHAKGRSLIVALALLATTASAWASGQNYGAAAAAAALTSGKALAVADMLRWAAEDEYLAHGEYATILRKFGDVGPYSTIISTEEQHLDWLRAEYITRGLAFPADGSTPYMVVPTDLKAAAQAGVDAEISNIAMYKAFLAQPEVSGYENASVKTLFERLMRASENHLRAFNTQSSKY
ncbi:MAG: hypothetical protein A2Y38_11000 [Spirochaetes bacterium GWB1_59_5]|nr:MAG: hypothetical protein A2Y38_11000 [Spirochaetes bacterium GWB1_59_5]